MFYNEGDTFTFEDSDNNRYSFYVDTVRRYFSTSRFLGVPHYKAELVDIVYYIILDKSLKGAIYAYKPEGIFQYYIDIEFPEKTFNLDYWNNEKHSHNLQKINQLILNNFTYSNVYIFNNATSDTTNPTQKVYLNTKYGFLKFEDLETGQIYTIVRE